MPHFICLITFTQQGLTQLGATTARAEAFAKMAEQNNSKVLATYWTLGQYDLVTVLESPDEKTACALALSTNAMGNVRSHTLPAFTVSEMKDEILPKVNTPYDLIHSDEDEK
jgi:uncharacterized protein with GYD domain